PSVPIGYDLVFGPLNYASNAPGYMGVVEIQTYDVDTCAAVCNKADADSNGGICKAINIWQPVINGTPAAYTNCALYYLPIDASTATNSGDATNRIAVTRSEGYARQNLLPSTGFEGFNCTFPNQNSPPCYTDSFGGWVGTSSVGGVSDATIVNSQSQNFAHFGHSAAQLGSQFTDQQRGTLTASAALKTDPGVDYILEFFIRAPHTPQQGHADIVPQMDILWNGKAVANISGIFVAFTRQALIVTAVGLDHLAFTGGFFPSPILLDDISL
ncbi:hypothetical protein C8J56DRAFT_1114958, partial [Mycena floridula]